VLSICFAAFLSCFSLFLQFTQPQMNEGHCYPFGGSVTGCSTAGVSHAGNFIRALISVSFTADDSTPAQ